jgi:DNA-binding IclR family transcriptional regulator
MKEKILAILVEKGTLIAPGTIAKRLILSQSKTNSLLEELIEEHKVVRVRIGKQDFYRAYT